MTPGRCCVVMAMGSLSMTCYGVGVEGMNCEEPDGAAQLPPDVPADQTNI